MGPVGIQELVVIFLVALVLFGPKKLPELGKTIGKAITEFRRAQSELKSTFDGHMRELEKEHESIKEVTSAIQTRFTIITPNTALLLMIRRQPPIRIHPLQQIHPL